MEQSIHLQQTYISKLKRQCEMYRMERDEANSVTAEPGHWRERVSELQKQCDELRSGNMMLSVFLNSRSDVRAPHGPSYEPRRTDSFIGKMMNGTTNHQSLRAEGHLLEVNRKGANQPVQHQTNQRFSRSEIQVPSVRRVQDGVRKDCSSAAV